MPRSGAREPMTRRPIGKAIKSERQRAKTASPIRKRPAGPRRVISQSQPRAQGLNQLTEAASTVEPTNLPPSSGQSSGSSTASDKDLSSVRRIAACAVVRRSPSVSNDRNTLEDVY